MVVYRAPPVGGADRVPLPVEVAGTVLQPAAAAGRVRVFVVVVYRAQRAEAADKVLPPAGVASWVPQLTGAAGRVRETAAAGKVPVREAEQWAERPLPGADSARKGWVKEEATDLPPAAYRLRGGVH